MSRTAFEVLVNLLKGREKSRARVTSQLLEKGFSGGEVDAALSRAVELGYLDDSRHAQVKARAGFAEGRSKGDVLRRLEAEGVDAAEAAVAVEEIAREVGYDERASAQALLDRSKKQGASAARFLLSRGFSEELVRDLLGLTDAETE